VEFPGIAQERKELHKQSFLSRLMTRFRLKTSRYAELEITMIQGQAKGNMPVAELCRKLGLSNASLYK